MMACKNIAALNVHANIFTILGWAKCSLIESWRSLIELLDEGRGKYQFGNKPKKLRFEWNERPALYSTELARLDYSIISRVAFVQGDT